MGVGNPFIRSNTTTHDNTPTYYVEALARSGKVPATLFAKRQRITPLSRLLQSGELRSLESSPRWALMDKFNRWRVNDAPQHILTGLFALLHAMLFGLFFVNYYYTEQLVTARATFGVSYVVSRSAAQVLHVDMALVLFPICRSFISILRRTPLQGIIPFDKNVTFHKMTAYSIVTFTCIHVAGHWHNFAQLATKQGVGLVGFLKLNFLTGPGWSGYIMLVALMAMLFTSLEGPRRRSYGRFWTVHHLFIMFFAFWSIHGAFCMIKRDTTPVSCSSDGSFWKYWMYGGFLYLLERILRETRATRRNLVTKVIQHPSNVVEIQFEKRSVRPRAGQYVFICCPAVSLWEYHPFTLTSAPEEDYLSVHVRMVGGFTKQLGRVLGCVDERQADSKIPKRGGRVLATHAQNDLSLPRIFVDGPFGTASEDVFKFETVLLVGAGIGVTPFASILKSLWYRIRDQSDRSPSRVRKVYFFWICRDFGSLEWFRSLLSAIEAQDRQGHIELHLVRRTRRPFSLPELRSLLD